MDVRFRGLALALLLACQPRQEQVTRTDPASAASRGPVVAEPRAPDERRGGIGPGPASRARFEVFDDSPPVELGDTAAAGLPFSRYRRGSFQMWHARGIPEPKADAVWRAVVERGRTRGLVAVLDRDEELDIEYFEQRVARDGRLTVGPALSFEAALDAREAALGDRAARMRRALGKARPSKSYREEVAFMRQVAEEARAERKEVETRAMTVFEGPVEKAGLFFVTGAELEPKPEELAAALGRWRDRYGATPRRWSSYDLELAVERPPSSLAELRELAWQFYLICPADPSGLTMENELPDELLARLQDDAWWCNWFVE